MQRGQHEREVKVGGGRRKQNFKASVMNGTTRIE